MQGHSSGVWGCLVSCYPRVKPWGLGFDKGCTDTQQHKMKENVNENTSGKYDVFCIFYLLVKYRMKIKVRFLKV